MKYIQPYNIPLEYNADWKKPNSPIRLGIEEDLKYIFLDLTDDDIQYKRNFITGGWSSGHRSKHPYVWISRGGRDIDMKEISNFIDRVCKYLESKGFESKVVPLSRYRVGRNAIVEIYIYFDETLTDI